ncbi:MAG: hypothetical protein EXS59_02515 [Candidatus Taylorbacteria bacterium]|nr:hypothetical protein [Candidatus Taylorbacteria bacterium]
MREHVKKILAVNPKLKKLAGVVLIIVGFLALITPLTPGSWLIFVGLELLGFDLIFWTKIKEWFRKK